MPRLPEVGSAAITNPFVKASYKNKFGDQEFETAPGNAWGGVRGNWETVMANSQEALETVVKSMAWVYNREKFKLPLTLRECALMRIGWVVESQFVFSQRSKIARTVGMSEEQIQAIPGWQVSDLFSPAERAVIAYVDSLILMNGRVADQIFDALKQHLTAEQIVDLTHVSNMYIGFAKQSRAFRVEFDDRDDPIVEVPTTTEQGHLPPLDIRGAERAERESREKEEAQA